VRREGGSPSRRGGSGRAHLLGDELEPLQLGVPLIRADVGIDVEHRGRGAIRTAARSCRRRRIRLHRLRRHLAIRVGAEKTSPGRLERELPPNKA
jgi:hypothetical protein